MRSDKAPIGLLGAFGLKNEGRNPSEFSDTIVPIVDVADMYMAPSTGSRGSTASGNLQNSGDTLTQTVPAGQMWRVWSVSAGIIVPAATANADGFGIGVLINASYVRVEYYRGPTPTVGIVRFSAGFMCPRPYLLPPGDSLQAIMQTTIGAAVPGFLVVIADRFEVS